MELLRVLAWFLIQSNLVSFMVEGVFHGTEHLSVLRFQSFKKRISVLIKSKRRFVTRFLLIRNSNRHCAPEFSFFLQLMDSVD